MDCVNIPEVAPTKFDGGRMRRKREFRDAPRFLVWDPIEIQMPFTLVSNMGGRTC